MKKRNKVNAEFNMSSLTDIIFLLLIFFMLTSSMVTPYALNLQLPGNAKTNNPKTNSKTDMIKIEPSGTFYLNNTKVSMRAIENRMRALRRRDGVNAAMTISPSKRASNDRVVQILDAAHRIKINPVLLEPR